MPNELTQRRKGKGPVLTILSCLAVLVFGFGSVPIINASLERQLAPENFNSEDARESTSQFSVIVFVAGVMASCAIGAAVGLGLGIAARRRKERWKNLAYASIAINSLLLLASLALVVPLIN